ncbi:MAG: CPXCG motif-containing cysteine-rich protein [Gammaproteobacteria bacterium]|nr:CPXCG motif-containing cysteine-rich protein [Gammaproteobacteria bacterium]
MNELETRKVHCPYCGESIDILIDCSIPEQNYIEDCQVCCRPINFDVTVDHEGDISVIVTNENE